MFNRKFKNKTIFTTSFLLLIMSPLVYGETCNTGNSAQQMSCLKVENLLLQERLENASILKNLHKMNDAPSVKHTQKLGFPFVVSTYGMGKHLSAVLLWMRHGESMGKMIVQKGDSIPGGWRVFGIQNGTVTIEKNGIKEVLLLNIGKSSSHQIGMQSNGRESISSVDDRPMLPPQPSYNGPHGPMGN